MGHIRLGTLPRSKKLRDVVSIMESGANVLAVAEAAARASELDLNRATEDPRSSSSRAFWSTCRFWPVPPGLSQHLKASGMYRIRPILCPIFSLG